MFRPLTRTQQRVDIVVAALFGLFALAATLIPWTSSGAGSGVVDERVAAVVAVLLTAACGRKAHGGQSALGGGTDAEPASSPTRG